LAYSSSLGRSTGRKRLIAGESPGEKILVNL
jgi:hypothetical protein